MPDGDVKKALLALLQNAKGDLDRAQQNIEQWFDDSMERVSGWYKRRTQWVTVCLAAVLTIATNADTVRIARILWTNNTVRSLLVEKAKSRVAASQSASDTTATTPGAKVEYSDKNNPLHPVFKAKVEKDETDALKSVLGWSGENLCKWETWPPRLLGWILSIIAISLGAPFWFDTLNKLMNIRNAGKKPKNSSDKDNGDGKLDAGKTAALLAGVINKVGSRS